MNSKPQVAVASIISASMLHVSQPKKLCQATHLCIYESAQPYMHDYITELKYKAAYCQTMTVYAAMSTHNALS